MADSDDNMYRAKRLCGHRVGSDGSMEISNDSGVVYYILETNDNGDLTSLKKNEGGNTIDIPVSGGIVGREKKKHCTNLLRGKKQDQWKDHMI